MGLSTTATNATGSTSFYAYIVDSVTSTSVYASATSSASTNVVIWGDAELKSPIYITDTCTLEINAGSVSNLDSYVTKMAAIRVR